MSKKTIKIGLSAEEIEYIEGVVESQYNRIEYLDRSARKSYPIRKEEEILKGLEKKLAEV